MYSSTELTRKLLAEHLMEVKTLPNILRENWQSVRAVTRVVTWELEQNCYSVAVDYNSGRSLPAYLENAAQ